MAITFRLEGIGHESGHDKLEQSMHKKVGKMAGAFVYTEPKNDKFTTVTPLLNSSFGADLNQNVTFSGSPEIIHNGGDSAEWDATAVQGTWNFADSAKITLTGGENNDTALFEEEGASTVDWANFTALTGKIDLDVYVPASQDFTIQFDLAGVNVGDALTLNQFIDTGNFSEQNFVIPKDNFNFGTTVVDGFTLALSRTGGAKPSVKFDDIQMEAAGAPASFVYTPNAGQETRLIAIQTIFVDNVTTANAADYNSLLGVAALSNGIIVSAQSEGKTVFSGTFTRLFDFLQTPNTIFTVNGDATNSFVTLNTQFNDNQVILKGSSQDNITYTINDNLSTLLEFRVFVTVTEDI